VLNRAATAFSLTVLALVAVGSVSAATERSASVGFTAAPNHINPGQTASLSVRVRPATARCRLAVAYAGGMVQRGMKAQRGARGRVTWSWIVPEDANPGLARATVSCGRAGRVTRTISVIGNLVPAKISVIQTGFSMRPKERSGARISYGVILENSSPNQDAYDLTVLVNFVGDDNSAWGSKVVKIAGIRAGGRYALGNYMDFPGLPPVTHLEVVVQIGGRAPAARKPAVLWTMPELVDVAAFPKLTEPEWIGGVSGEVVHNSPKWILDRAALSAVVFDAAGNIIGGGYGTHSISLLPSARAVFRITSGFDSIKTVEAASTMVSVTPQYRQPGS
jgi:hypothetical protein